MESLSTGVPGLDRILRGGLVPRSLHVIGGLPGTGKTSLAQQISYHHAKTGGKVLYLAALSETADRLVGHAGGFSFYDPALVAQRIYYVSMYPKLEEGGLPSVFDEIRRLCVEHRISLLCMDGLAALKSVAPSPLEFRRFVFDLNAQARSLGVTSVLLGHWDIGHSDEPEFAVADGILALSLESSVEGAARYLEVFKLRGAGNLSGPHQFAITGDGVSVFPRLEAALHADGIEQPQGEWSAISTGTEGLDRMLHGGVPSGSVTLVAGASGVGKTVLALSFLSSSGDEGDRGLYVGFGEAPSRLLTRADSLRLKLRERVEKGGHQMVWVPAVELIPDQIAWQILDLVEQQDIRRLVIDDVDRLAFLLAQDGRLLPFLTAFLGALRSRGVTTFMTHDTAEADLFGLGMAFQQVGTVADSVIVLQYAALESRQHRQLSVLKVRDSEFDPEVREFTISSGGILVEDAPFGSQAEQDKTEKQSGRGAE
jgi:circadian clock protein KaiC